MPKNNPSFLLVIAVTIAILLGSVSKNILSARDEWFGITIGGFFTVVVLDFFVAFSIGVAIASILYGLTEVGEMAITGISVVVGHNAVRILGIVKNLLNYAEEAGKKKIDNMME